MSASGKWKFAFRDDQTDFLKSVLEYIIERHTNRAQNTTLQPIDTFAHGRSCERAREILDEIKQVTE